ncbi:hypothetical protein ACN93_19865 [Gordonia paraffinivorans]|uniref:hypothetical protein n=1 Tax=Gordonia paraffinivorans TaxID=175628 RepID=UPI000D6172C0|nr:hypothetical protein [Gordonia paraffinivorans]PWD41319.1 hypothetical protein ACN93_19865 [Gordonia paraffinivorans]
MTMSGRLGRTLRVLIWVMPIALLVIFVLGREFLGGSAGWASVLAIAFSPAVLVALYLPVVVATFDRRARDAGSLRRAFTWTTIGWYACAVGVIVSIPDGGDSGDRLSPLMPWTGISDSASEVIAVCMLGALAVALAASLVAATAGVVASRRIGQGPTARSEQP